jgi:hypothetical protein
VAIAVVLDPTLTLGEVIVGIGTLALALVTWMLARSSARSVEALDLPFVLASSEGDGAFSYFPVDPEEEEPEDFEWSLSLSLDNLGRGPAIVDGIELRNKTAATEMTKTHWSWDRAVKAGEKTIHMAVPIRDEPPDRGEEVAVRVLYRSATGARYLTDHVFEVGRNLRAHRITFERRRPGRLRRFGGWPRQS